MQRRVGHEGDGRWGPWARVGSVPQGAQADLGSCKVAPPVTSLSLPQEADPPPERDPVPQRPLRPQPCGHDAVHQ